MPLVDENVAAGLPEDSPFQVGKTSIDDGTFPEKGIGLPWSSESSASYMYYECMVMAVLDSGIVVHNRLPQVDGIPDTLASTSLDDPNLDKIIGPGVNLKCHDQYTDIIQRMGHSRYWFRIYGQAIRVGYPVPIPGIVKIGGVPAIPYDLNPQWALNSIVPGGNYGGVILWHARWSLWYTTATPPVSNTIPASDPSAHISSVVKPPNSIQIPYGPAEDDSMPNKPGGSQINQQAILSPKTKYSGY